MSSTVLDIVPVGQSTINPSGSVKYKVAISATLIYPGEPVARALGGIVVTPMTTNKPVVSTDFLVGIAVTTSTNTASAAGYVQVLPLLPGQIWAISPNDSTAWNTQALYDALVGKRVLLDLTAGKYTILASDSATSGCVVIYKDIKTDNPSKVYFTFRNAVCDLS
jgi:hypothetical protein